MAVLGQLAAFRAEPGYAIRDCTRMCLGATLAAAVRSRGLQKYRRTGWVDCGGFEATRAEPAETNKRSRPYPTTRCACEVYGGTGGTGNEPPLAVAALRRNARGPRDAPVNKQDN